MGRVGVSFIRGKISGENGSFYIHVISLGYVLLILFREDEQSSSRGMRVVVAVAVGRPESNTTGLSTDYQKYPPPLSPHLWWHYGDIMVTLLWWHYYGDIMVTLWWHYYGDIIMVVLWWHYYGDIMVTFTLTNRSCGGIFICSRWYLDNATGQWFFSAQYTVVLIVIVVYYDETSVVCTCSRVVYYLYCITCYSTFSGFKGACLTRKKVPKSTSNVAHLPFSSPFHHAHFFLCPGASSALQTRKLKLKSGHRTHSQRRPHPTLSSSHLYRSIHACFLKSLINYWSTMLSTYYTHCRMEITSR